MLDIGLRRKKAVRYIDWLESVDGQVGKLTYFLLKVEKGKDSGEFSILAQGSSPPVESELRSSPTAWSSDMVPLCMSPALLLSLLSLS